METLYYCFFMKEIRCIRTTTILNGGVADDSRDYNKGYIADVVTIPLAIQLMELG